MTAAMPPAPGGARAGARQRIGDQRDALRDRAVPARPVLSLNGINSPPRRCAPPPGIGHSMTRAAGDLTVVGQQAVQHAGEPDRLGGQLDAREVGPGSAGVPSLKIR